MKNELRDAIKRMGEHPDHLDEYWQREQSSKDIDTILSGFASCVLEKIEIRICAEIEILKLKQEIADLKRKMESSYSLN